MTTALKVLISNAETDSLITSLKARFPQVQALGCTSYADLPKAVAKMEPDAVYSVRFDGSTDFPRDALFGSAGPRWIANGGAGTDHLGNWDTDRVTVTNAAGVAAEMMAEYIIGGFLHFTLDVPGLQMDQTNRVWNARTVRPLKGATLLIVGLGNTGRALAQRAQSFGMHVIGTRARPRAMEHVDEVHASDALLSLLPRADFVAVCTPLTPATRGLISRAAIDAMKPGGVLADVSRGGVVDQTALRDALHQGHVGGAALDVFETEPLPPDNPMWAAPNVLISPHCSSVHDGWEAASFEIFLDNLGRFMSGDPLVNVVDPERGY